MDNEESRFVILLRALGFCFVLVQVTGFGDQYGRIGFTLLLLSMLPPAIRWIKKRWSG
jgi:hypothetical protein